CAVGADRARSTFAVTAAACHRSGGGNECAITGALESAAARFDEFDLMRIVALRRCQGDTVIPALRAVAIWHGWAAAGTRAVLGWQLGDRHRRVGRGEIAGQQVHRHGSGYPVQVEDRRCRHVVLRPYGCRVRHGGPWVVGLGDAVEWLSGAEPRGPV